MPASFQATPIGGYVFDHWTVFTAFSTLTFGSNPLTLTVNGQTQAVATFRLSTAPQNYTGVPCPPIVKRPDGSLVSSANPAKAGEELSALAVGLGHTYPLGETGKVVKDVRGTTMEFAMDFNYRRNALGTRPPPVDTPGVPKPTYTAAKEGEVGLYEVRFIVPPVPHGTPPCETLPTVPPLPTGNVVYSNLTFSIGGQYSFDGAGICVAVDEE